MPQYSVAALEKHWLANQTEFRTAGSACHEAFVLMISVMSDVSSLLSGRKVLDINCAYLLLTKAMNHVASTLLLIERGLMIDGALTSRNAIETLLLLELLAKKPELCRKWSAGEQLTPGSVRKELAKLPKVEVGDLVIEVSSDTWDETRFVYDWLSQITHANLDSLNQSASQTDRNNFVLHVGGALLFPVAIAITKSLGHTCLRSLATCLAVFEPTKLQMMSAQFERLGESLNSLSPGEKR
jgi:hypothetical protein